MSFSCLRGSEGIGDLDCGSRSHTLDTCSNHGGPSGMTARLDWMASRFTISVTAADVPSLDQTRVSQRVLRVLREQVQSGD